MRRERILVIQETGCDVGRRLQGILVEKSGYEVDLVEGWSREDEGRVRPPHVVALVVPGSAARARRLLSGRWDESVGTPLLLVVENAAEHLEDEALRFQAADFLTTPFHEAEVLIRIQRLLLVSKQARRRSEPERSAGYGPFVGEDPAFLAVKRRLALVARCHAPVLLTGETGTGKEICARAIHYLGPRAGKPFLPVNCGAIPVELFESELFGHQKGAFTGATASRSGLIAEADGGTLFLDEIEALNLSAQAKLLRFLQDQTYYALGSSRPRRSDVRIVAATNRELTDEVRSATFREDLYYRLAVLPLTLPPLRERPADIPLLVTHFWGSYAGQQTEERQLSVRALEALCRYPWPGNVRQLENVIQQVLILSEGRVVEPEHLPIPVPKPSPTGRSVSMSEAKANALEAFEKRYVSEMLRAHHGNVTQAARAAGKDRRAFGRLIKKYQLTAT